MQTKASRQSLEDFLALYNRLKEQLQITLNASVRAGDETLSQMKSCLRSLEEEDDCKRNLSSALSKFEEESRIFEETLRLMRLLTQMDIPKARTHFEESLRTLEALLTLRNTLTVVSNPVGDGVSTGKLQRHHHSSRGVNAGVKRSGRSEILNQAVERASQLVTPSKPFHLKYERLLKGKTGEILFMHTCTAQGLEFTDLNAIKTNMWGYDAKVGDEWVSVKILGTPGNPNLCSYRRTLDLLAGYSDPPRGGKFAGQRLPQVVAHYILDDDELAKRFSQGQSVEELSEELRENGCLALPDDHAEELKPYLRETFRKYALENPKRYGIDRFASPESQERAVHGLIEDYCRRIRPIGFASHEIHYTLERALVMTDEPW